MDDAVAVVQALGKGTRLVKMDLKDAYRIVPVHPDDYHLPGILWYGQSTPFWLAVSIQNL